MLKKLTLAVLLAATGLLLMTGDTHAFGRRGGGSCECPCPPCQPVQALIYKDPYAMQGFYLAQLPCGPAPLHSWTTGSVFLNNSWSPLQPVRVALILPREEFEKRMKEVGGAPAGGEVPSSGK